MTFYTLSYPAGTAETGSDYPQVQKMAPGYDFKAHNSIYATARQYQKLPDFEPNLDYFILAGRAKATDLLSVALVNTGFLVSGKLKSILENFNLPTHRFYPARVKKRNEFLEYYYLHVICNLSAAVNYEKSQFFIYKNYSISIGDIEVNSMEEYDKKQQELRESNPGKVLAIWASQIVLPAAKLDNLDLFSVGKFNGDYFISERLRQALVNEKITGCEVQESTKLIVE